VVDLLCKQVRLKLLLLKSLAELERVTLICGHQLRIRVGLKGQVGCFDALNFIRVQGGFLGANSKFIVPTLLVVVIGITLIGNCATLSEGVIDLLGVALLLTMVVAEVLNEAQRVWV